MPKNVQATTQLCLFTCQQCNAQNPSSYASTVYELTTSRYTNWLQKRQRNQTLNCQHPLDHRKNKGIPEKKIYFCFIDYAKAFDCVNHSKLWKILLRGGNTRPPDLPLEKSVCRSGSNSQNWTWQQTDSKQEKEYIKAVCCHPAYLTSMQSTS